MLAVDLDHDDRKNRHRRLVLRGCRRRDNTPDIRVRPVEDVVGSSARKDGTIKAGSVHDSAQPAAPRHRMSLLQAGEPDSDFKNRGGTGFYHVALDLQR